MRFSLRTLIIVMLLGGPLCAWVLREWSSYEQRERETTSSSVAPSGTFIVHSERGGRWRFEFIPDEPAPPPSFSDRFWGQFGTTCSLCRKTKGPGTEFVCEKCVEAAGHVVDDVKEQNGMVPAVQSRRAED